MTTYTSQPDETSANDTFIQDTAANTNWGANAEIKVGEFYPAASDIQRTLIKFDLSSIPAGATITSAILTLTVSANAAANARDYKMFRVLRNWVELQATWNIFSTGNNWGTAGCSNTATDYDPTAHATTNFAATITLNTEKTFSINTTEFKKMVDGTYQNYGWLIKADSEANDAHAFHSSSATTASYRPKLVVEYTANSGNFFMMFS